MNIFKANYVVPNNPSIYIYVYSTVQNYRFTQNSYIVIFIILSVILFLTSKHVNIVEHDVLYLNMYFIFFKVMTYGMKNFIHKKLCLTLCKIRGSLIKKNIVSPKNFINIYSLFLHEQLDIDVIAVA